MYREISRFARVFCRDDASTNCVLISKLFTHYDDVSMNGQAGRARFIRLPARCRYRADARMIRSFVNEITRIG